MRSYGRLLIAIAGLALLGGCGGTWVEDAGNFKRIFGFDMPTDVQVLHSYYWKSSHWSTEYRYYIAMRSSSKFTAGLTSAKLMTPAVPEESALEACGGSPPQWFVSKPPSRYEMWVPKNSAAYRVFRDKDDSTIYVCDEQL
jgi:hypothetical protein